MVNFTDLFCVRSLIFPRCVHGDVDRYADTEAVADDHSAHLKAISSDHVESI